jgi:hypothetical protein
MLNREVVCSRNDCGRQRDVPQELNTLGIYPAAALAGAPLNRTKRCKDLTKRAMRLFKRSFLKMDFIDRSFIPYYVESTAEIPAEGYDALGGNRQLSNLFQFSRFLFQSPNAL